MSQYTRSDAFKKRKLMAEDRVTDPKILAELARDSDKRVRLLVAGNPACPLEALRVLFWQRDYDVRQAVARNDVVPSDFFTVVVRHPSTGVLLSDKSGNVHPLLIEPHGAAFSEVAKSARNRLSTMEITPTTISLGLFWVPANPVSPPETLARWAIEHPKTTADTLAALAFGQPHRVFWTTAFWR